MYRYERDALAKQKQRELAERHRAELEAELEALLEAQSMQRRLLEGKQQLVSTGELEVGQLQARGSSTLTTRSSNASRDSPALTPHPSPYLQARLDADKEKLVEMRAREKALEATEAAAAAAAEKRQAEVEMNLSASERLAALHQTYIAKIAAPSANAADAVASGASTPRGGGGWRSPPPQTPTRAALRAEAETNARRSVATAEEAQGRLKERRASYQAERLDERERVR